MADSLNIRLSSGRSLTAECGQRRLRLLLVRGAQASPKGYRSAYPLGRLLVSIPKPVSVAVVPTANGDAGSNLCLPEPEFYDY
ncbi:MAG: hypothetical protein QNJ55_29265 [Xenococcus sp. MO_188.B8]|nr:hypothetical protein [Xenococcus sp. MO_188.B8]